MPRIAYISSTFPDYQKCGTGTYAGHITQALSEQGHDVHVITTALPEIVSSLGKVSVHKVMQSWNPTDLPRLIQVMHQIRPDLIHINHPTSIAAAKSKVLVNLIPEMNRHTWKVPVVTTLHEFHQVSLLGKIKLAPLCLASDAVTVTNERYRQRLERFLPRSQAKKIHVINIGPQFRTPFIESDSLEERKKWGLEPDDRVLGFMGFITPPKGFHNLIAALGPLMRKDPKLKLLALSSWNQTTPSYREKIQDQIRKEGITRQIVMTGFLGEADVWKAMPAVDLFVFPFDYPVEERSSGPLRQAIVRGIPTLTFAEEVSYSEFGFHHGENIWLTPFKNFEKLREDIVEILDQKSIREKLSKGALALRPSFSYDTVSNAFSRLYSDLLSL